MIANKTLFTLQEISEWHKSGFVELPKVQRGFVWRPKQIEDLWDSLLRKYPVGAFVLSPKGNNKFEILDGQQRATAICLGFGKETFRETEDKIKVFIDLKKPGSEDSRKYLFRVITKSHAWGYQRVNNSKPLDSNNKRKAMKLYVCDDFLNPDLNNFFPYDSSISIPFNYFLEAASQSISDSQLLEKVKKWHLWGDVVSIWFSSLKENPTWLSPDIIEIDSMSKIENRIIDIFQDVKEMLKSRQIPTLYLDDFKTLSKNNSVDNEDNDDGKDEEDENRNDEIENLFIRLNAGGTPLRGEELNYSILKAHISKSLQNQIEQTCEGFSQPARFITIAYRLFQQFDKNQLREGLSMTIKPKQFQRTVNENLKEFELFIHRILNEKKYEGKTLIQYAIYLLEFESVKNPDGLPHIIVSKITDVAPEIIFMFLFRIYKGDKFILGEAMHRKSLGTLTLFMWLGKGQKHKDHSKLLRNIWPAVVRLNKESFWSSTTVKRAMLNEVLPPIPTFNKSRDRYSLQKIIKYPYQRNSDLLKKFDKETEFGSFAFQVFFNRNLILYSQRKFLSEIFKKKEYYIDDMDLPFDWDHLSPHNLVNKKHGIPYIIKDWYQSIGNLRAWPYSLNRTDQDVVPAKKLDPLNKRWNTVTNTSDFEKTKMNWNEFISKNKNLIKAGESLKAKLLEWSFCENEKWETCEIDDLRDDWKKVFELIRDRSLSIINEWYDKFLIEKLIPEKLVNTTNIFSGFLNNSKWSKNPHWLKVDNHGFDTKENINWILKRPIKSGDSEIYLYFSHSIYPDTLIDEGYINFGIHDKNKGSYITSLKLSDKELVNIQTDKNTYLQKNLTLISTQNEAYIDLLVQIKDWIKTTKFKQIKSEILDAFTTSLKGKFQSKI